MTATLGNIPVLAADLVSQRRNLSISSPAENDPRLPGATLIEGNVIDLSAFLGDAHVRLAPWILSAPGQGVWLWVTFDNQTIEVLSAHVVTAAEVIAGVNAALPRNELAGMKDGTVLVVHASVSFGGSATQPIEENFPPNAYVLRHGLGTGGGDMLEERFTGVPAGTHPLKPYELPTKTMSVTAINDAQFEQSTDSPGVELVLWSQASAAYATFAFARPMWLVILEFKVPRVPNATHLSAKFLDGAGTLLATRPLDPGQANVIYAPHSSNRIHSVAITMMASTGVGQTLLGISGSYVPV